jgi:hypothetical protein
VLVVGEEEADASVLVPMPVVPVVGMLPVLGVLVPIMLVGEAFTVFGCNLQCELVRKVDT